MISKHGYTYTFDPSKCGECGGKCCCGDSGYVFVSIDEMKKIAEFLHIDLDTFGMRYIRQVGLRYSLIEKPCKDKARGISCIFFDENSNQCSIYNVRPNQCIAFPFWKSYKNDISELQERCIGVNINTNKS